MFICLCLQVRVYSTLQVETCVITDICLQAYVCLQACLRVYTYLFTVQVKKRVFTDICLQAYKLVFTGLFTSILFTSICFQYVFQGLYLQHCKYVLTDFVFNFTTVCLQVLENE